MRETPEKTSTKGFGSAVGVEGSGQNTNKERKMRKSMDVAVKSLEAIRARWLKELSELQAKVREKEEDVRQLDIVITSAKGTKKADAAPTQSIS